MLQCSSVDGDKHCHLLFVYSLSKLVQCYKDCKDFSTLDNDHLQCAVISMLCFFAVLLTGALEFDKTCFFLPFLPHLDRCSA